MENITSFNYGQVILYAYLCTSIEGRTGKSLSASTLSKIINLVIELTDEEHYNDEPTECPDVQIMTNPENSFKIFCDWYDENETLIVDNLLTTV
jgi:hypothetical protein